MMSGYDIYCFCRSLIHRKKPAYESYCQSNVCHYYDSLSDYLQCKLSLSEKDTRDYIKVNYAADPDNFNPFSLVNQDAHDIYTDWKAKRSNKALYYDEVLKGIAFIENFCIGRKLEFDEYVSKYASKHIRENKFDWIIAVHCNMINISELKKVEKILLKKFLAQYNIIRQRLNSGELVNIMNDRILQMKEILRETKYIHSKQVTK